MTTIRADIDIDAPAPRVWEILMDFAAYGQWNPFVARLEGDAREGASLRAAMCVGGKEVPVEVEVVRVAVQSEFAWSGGFRPRFLLNAVHRFRIEPCGSESVRFVQEELIRGLLSPIMMMRMKSDIARQFVAMNVALKRRAEEERTWRRPN